MAEFADLIEDIENMPFESQEILIDIINKRFSERKRELFIAETLNSKNEFDKGSFQEGASEALFKAMNI